MNVMRGANETIRMIADWMDENHFELAVSKTEAVIVRGPRKREGVMFFVTDMRDSHMP